MLLTQGLFQRVDVPRDGSCFYHALACVLMDAPDAVRVYGLTGDAPVDARHIRNWVATTIFTDKVVHGWLRERLDLIREVPDLLDDFDFVKESLMDEPTAGMHETLRRLARAIAKSTTYVSEFEVDVVRHLLQRQVWPLL